MKITAHERSRITGLGRHWVLVDGSRYIVADIYGKGGRFRLVPRVPGPLSAKIESFASLEEAVQRAEGEVS